MRISDWSSDVCSSDLAPGEQAWPITATNFILMYEQPANPKRSAAAREFFTWALENGQQQAAELDYVPLPPELVGQIEQYWAAEFKSADRKSTRLNSSH